MAPDSAWELLQEAVFSRCKKSKDEKDDIVHRMVIHQGDNGAYLRVIESNL